MLIDVPAELAKGSYTFHYYRKYVDLDGARVIYDYTNAWRQTVAAYVSKDLGHTSCIIDGVRFGPAPTGQGTRSGTSNVMSIGE
jgi:hypothetical protein